MANLYSSYVSDSKLLFYLSSDLEEKSRRPDGTNANYGTPSRTNSRKWTSRSTPRTWKKLWRNKRMSYWLTVLATSESRILWPSKSRVKSSTDLQCKGVWLSHLIRTPSQLEWQQKHITDKSSSTWYELLNSLIKSDDVDGEFESKIVNGGDR